MAKEIYQQAVDAINAAILARDLAALHRRIALPLLVTTNTSQLIITTIEELDLILCDYHAQLRKTGVTQYRRTCLKAAFQPHDPDMIVGVHRSEIMANARYVVAPFLCHVAFMKIGGLWKAVWEQAAVDERDLQMLNPEMVRKQKQVYAALAQRRAVCRSPG
jgi:hypothetical protein